VENIQDFTYLETTNSEIFKTKRRFSIKSHERSIFYTFYTYDVALLFESFQECSKYFSNVDDEEEYEDSQ
jgi:hypothetical protein